MLTAEQLRAARALLGWSQGQLAEAADLALSTIKRMEGSDGPVRGNVENVRSARSALEAAGVAFIDEDGGGAGVRLRKAVARLLSRRYNLDTMVIMFRVSFAGEEVMCRVRETVLEDWQRTNYQGQEECEGAFDEHRNTIMALTNKLIEAGRVHDGSLELLLADFG